MADVKACIFDLDGVIVDTAKFHFLAWRRLGREFGFDLTEEENEGLKGISRAKSLDILLEKSGVEATPEEREDMMARKNGWYLEYVNTMNAGDTLPGVSDFLDKVKASGRKMALGSASKNAVPILRRIDLLKTFDAVIDGTKVTRGKPHPETFLLGAEALYVAPENCVVFEDASAGIEGALAAGMYAVGVGTPEVLGKAHLVIPGFADRGLEIFDEF